MTKEEAREFTAIARRLTAIILLSDELDANYAACRDFAVAFTPPSTDVELEDFETDEEDGAGPDEDEDAI